MLTGLLAVMLGACGCLGSLTRGGKLQESALNLNQATRFGRMDLALELVAAKAQGEFAKRHGAWGRDIRLVDLEMQGATLKDKDTAVVLVMVGWQRLDETELRVTQLMQTWRYEENGWRLALESRSGGDLGLLGEQTVIMRPEAHEDVHFRSVTIQ